MQAPHAEAAEQQLPVDVTRREHTGRTVAAVGDADCAAHPEATLGEVQPVPRPAPHSVERHPAHQTEIDTAGEHQVLDESAHVVVAQRGHDGGARAEAAAQAAGHVVPAAALPAPELAGGAYAPVAVT